MDEAIYLTTKVHPELKEGIKMYVDSRDNVYNIACANYVKDIYNKFYAYSKYINENIHKGWFEKIQ